MPRQLQMPGRHPMNDNALFTLQVRILRFFLTEAQQVGPMLTSLKVQPHNRRSVKKLVYALYLAGLLERWGATSGTTYRTSRLGYVVLVTLDEDLTHKRRGYDQTKVC
jgi:hypothetical protein